MLVIFSKILIQSDFNYRTVHGRRDDGYAGRPSYDA